MNRQWSRSVRNLAAQLGGRFRRENTWHNGNCIPGCPFTDARVRRHRRCSVVERNVGQCHLWQNQDDGEQRQFKNQDRKLPTLHGNTTCTEPRITLPRARCQSGTSAGRWSCRADRAVGGWSRPSSLHTSAVSHWALAAEVPQGLKPHRNTAFNEALKRSLENSPKNQ